MAGVNLVGFVEGERDQGKSVRMGLSEIVRRVARGLDQARIPFVTVAYRPSSAQGESTSRLLAEAVYDTNLICLNADYLQHFLADVGPRFFVGKASVGFWFWETSTFRLAPGTPLACLDEVWVASSYVRDAVAAAVDLPVFVAPLPMDLPAAPARERSALGMPDGFVFLFAFNFVSGVRKNPMAALNAFKQAFAPGEGPSLVLKGVNGRERKPNLLAELERAADDRPDVVVLDRYVGEDEVRAMIAACDCYVSLHRSEGLGLTIAEAMAYGKPVIATGYSGNLELMDERSGYLVPYREVPVPSDWWAYSPGASWAEPDVAAAADLMRSVWEDPEEARRRAALTRDRLLRRFNVDRTAEFASRRLAELRGRVALTARTPGSGARGPILEASDLLRADVGESLQHPGSGAVSRLRGTLRRALWPYLASERKLDTAMLQGIVGLQRSLEELERRVERLEASSQAPGTEDDRLD